MNDADADVIVVGGGPAGLSAALCLARYDRSVLLFDTGRGRSSYAQVNRNVVGFPGGIAVTELCANGRAQLADYPHVQLSGHTVEQLEAADGGFRVTTRAGGAAARAVVLAPGVVDSYPHVPGWESLVGTSLFWCIACDGYENRGRRLVVLGHDDAAAGEALQLRGLTDHVCLLTNSAAGTVSAHARARLEAAGVGVVDDKLERAVVDDDGALTHLLTARGRRVDADGIFSVQGTVPETRLARQLGVRLTEAGYVAVDPEQRTSVPGVFAAGDVTALHSQQIATALHEGGTAASSANWHLLPGALRLA